MDGPVIVCGLGRAGLQVLDCLRTAGVAIVAVDTQAEANDPRLVGVRVVRGDCRDARVLAEAGLATARGVLILTSDDLVNLACALLVRRLAPDVRIVLRMFNRNLVTRLGKAVNNVSAQSVSALAAPLMALTAATGDVLATFPVGEQRLQIAQLTVSEGSVLEGFPVGQFNDTGPCQLIAHQPLAQTPHLAFDIDPETRLEIGDRLIVAGMPTAIRKLLEPDRGDLSNVLWAGKIRRFGRVAYRTFAEMDLAVKVCSIAMLVAVLLSTSIYHYGLGLSWADGIYRTISVIATGGEMGGAQYEGWGKVFVSALRIFGTVLVAAFTAILTNYLIRAKLGGVFEVRRIPDSGHVAVIGLGNVGLRVVEELVRLQERVVVVELKADNHFIASCRRLGAAVIIGDATVRNTLKAAHIEKARAVVVATHADLVNLEIALLIAELNEKQRVVVRLGDGILAETARTTAGVKLAVSLPELAAPAFLAGLLGDRVLTMFLVGGQMLAVLELTVTAAEHLFLNQSLQTLAIDYRILPVAVLSASQKDPITTRTHRLRDGDKLLLITTVPDMDRLTRREPAPAIHAVEVSAFPLSARETLLLQVRIGRAMNAADAEQVIARVPFTVAEKQTRGQAEELLGILQREKITARLVENVA